VGLALTHAPGAVAWSRSASALWRRSLGVTYVLGGAEVVALEGTAAAAWELLAAPTTTDVLTGSLAELYGEARATIAPEVAGLLERLAVEGLVTRSGLDSAPAAEELRTVTHDGSVDAVDPVAGLAGWGLPGCALRPPDPEVAGWPALLASIRRERLTGLAVAAHLAGQLALDADGVADLRAAHGDAMVTCLRLERRLLETVDLLEGAGVEPIVIKGPSVAHRHCADPSERPFGDIDLLIPDTQLDAAYAVLAAAGHRRRFPEPRPGFDRRFGKGAAFVATDGLELDIHRTFASGPFGMTVDARDAHAAPAHFELAGRRLRALAGAPDVVSLAMHAALGTRLPRLLNLRDVVQAAATTDADAVVALATRWRVDGPVALALRHAIERFSLATDAPLLAWASRHEMSAMQQRALRAYIDPDRGFARQALAALPALPTTRDRAAYVRALLLPDRSYVTPRDASRGRRWLRIVRTASRARR